MHLEREDEWRLRHHKSRLDDCGKNVYEFDARDERATVRHGRLAICTIPEVDLEAAAAFEQHAVVHSHFAASRELVADDVGVVRRLDEVFGERQREILIGVERVFVQRMVGHMEEEELKVTQA